MSECEVGDGFNPPGIGWLAEPPRPAPHAHQAEAMGGCAADPERDLVCRLQVLAYELTVAEARERQRIAQLLHDELGQLLAMAQFKLGELSLKLGRSGQPDPFEELRLLVCEAAKATRVTTYELHSPVLEQLGLDAAVHSLAQRLRRTSAMRVQVDGAVGALPLPETVLSVVFRVVRELAQNAQRHARAAHLWLAMDRDDAGLRICVTDDGVGFDASAVPRQFSPAGGFGLFSAEAHMQAIGGRLLLVSAHGQGTTATIELGLGDDGASPQWRQPPIMPGAASALATTPAPP